MLQGAGESSAWPSQLVPQCKFTYDFDDDDDDDQVNWYQNVSLHMMKMMTQRNGDNNDDKEDCNNKDDGDDHDVLNHTTIPVPEAKT